MSQPSSQTSTAHNKKVLDPQSMEPSNLPTDQSSSLPIFARWTLLGGLLLAALGASFAPWVYRPPAALILTAPDLAEFVKFLPEVRDRSLTVHRLLFLLPLFIATFALPFVTVSARLTFPRWARWLVFAFVIPMALTLLPPVWSPGVLLSPEFGLQTLACLLCLGLVVVSRWLRSIPARLLSMLLIPPSAAAPVLALWQFFLAREAIARAYVGPIAPGWGAWLVGAGFILTILGALLTSWSFVPTQYPAPDRR